MKSRRFTIKLDSCEIIDIISTYRCMMLQNCACYKKFKAPVLLSNIRKCSEIIIKLNKIRFAAGGAFCGEYKLIKRVYEI